VPFGIGTLEIVILLAVLLIAFGPSQLPKIARSMGSGAREVKDAITLMPSDDDGAPARPHPPSDDADRRA
jgi:sec-independent protein translocase protein TatA